MTIIKIIERSSNFKSHPYKDLLSLNNIISKVEQGNTESLMLETMITDLIENCHKKICYFKYSYNSFAIN